MVMLLQDPVNKQEQDHVQVFESPVMCAIFYLKMMDIYNQIVRNQASRNVIISLAQSTACIVCLIHACTESDGKLGGAWNKAIDPNEQCCYIWYIVATSLASFLD